MGWNQVEMGSAASSAEKTGASLVDGVDGQKINAEKFDLPQLYAEAKNLAAAKEKPAVEEKAEAKEKSAAKDKTGAKDKAASCPDCEVPSLPELDLHSGTDLDHGGPSVAEDLIDDLFTVIKNNDGKVTIREKQAAEMEQSGGELPVIYAPGVEPGHIGIMLSKHKDGHTYYTPFLAGDPKIVSPRNGPGTVTINESAAKELRMEDELKNGGKIEVDIVAIPLEAGTSIVVPKTKDDLHSYVKDRLREMSEDIIEKQAKEWQQIEASLPDPPKPDAQFGYRRTERSDAELAQISEQFEKLARESQAAWDKNGIADRMKEFGKQAQKDIDKYQDEIKKRSIDFDRLEKEEKLLEKRAEKLQEGSAEAALLKQRASAASENAAAVNNALELAKYNLSYAQVQLKISKDEALYTRHMQARASAAAMMSLNPDMEGSLAGRRVVLNSGHWPGDPKFPGFEKDGIPEWKLNFESQAVAAEMLRMAGAGVKLVNQIDMPKDERGMTGLAAAIKAAKPEVAISIHHDDSDPRDSDAMKGTLTLQCAKTAGAESLEYARAIHNAKLNYAAMDEKFNKNGVPVGIREQCGRGIQGHNVGAPFILDEQLSTHKDYWPLALDPKVNARIQFSKVTSIYEYLNKTPRYKHNPQIAQEWKDKIWSKNHLDDIWTKRPKVGHW